MFTIKPHKTLLIKLTTLILFLLTSCTSTNNIKPFTSDGCSSFPNGTLNQKNLWLSCCVTHDKAYWKGGSYKQRREADIALKLCVEQLGEADIAQLMLTGVRVGGSPYFPTEFRWGYGWPYPRGYKELSHDELKEVLKLTNKTE